MRDRLLPPGVYQEPDQITPHIVPAEVRKRLRQMALIQVNIDKDQAFEVLVWLGE